MFVSTNTCDGKGECIKQCPTKAIRLINGKALSCLTCGLCYKNCPSNAIFINSYGGYVVDRAKCSGCGMCMYNCPINNIKIEEGLFTVFVHVVEFVKNLARHIPELIASN